MPVLKNPRHERFAQALASGETADAAYQIAGFKPNRGNASTLKAKQNIIDRVAELQQRGAKRAEVTIESLIDELEEARALARAQAQASAMSQATFYKARISGLVIDKKEDVTPHRSLADIEAAIERKLARAAAGSEGGATGPAGGAGAGSGDDEALPTVSGHGTA